MKTMWFLSFSLVLPMMADTADFSRDIQPILAEYCKTRGKIALSGILESQEDDIKKIYSQWFDFDSTYKKDGWILISGTKR